MKIRWRKHELVLATLLTTIAIFGFAINSHHLTAEQIAAYAQPFLARHIPFSYSQNIVLPQICSITFLYAYYLVIADLATKAFSRTKRRKLSTYVWIALLMLIASYLFALGINMCSYYAHPTFYNYGGFNVLASLGINEEPMTNLFTGFDRASYIAPVIAGYIFIREQLIYRLEKETPNKLYRILITNQITALFVIYITVPFFIAMFHIIESDAFYTGYFIFVTPTLFTYLNTTYRLFPAIGENSIFNRRFIIELTASTFVYTFICSWLFTHADFRNEFFLSWGAQLLIVTPVTWLIYQQQKDKILQLKGAEKALLKSKADLQFLRSQINPHFLFNALNTLYGTALLDGSKRTADGIQKLGDMMRFMLHDNHLDFIPMDSEIAYLKNYIALQKLRIQSAPNILFEEYINESGCNHLIAPMLLIPFVENAFKHGISLTEQSWIKVKLNCDKNKIRFEVRNSVHAKQHNDPEKEHSGIGLENVHERLLLFYKDKHVLSYGIKDGEFVVELELDPIEAYSHN